MTKRENGIEYFLAYDLKTGKVVEDLREDDLGEYRVRYFPHAHGILGNYWRWI